jgi:hypothetical protein
LGPVVRVDITEILHLEPKKNRHKHSLMLHYAIPQCLSLSHCVYSQEEEGCLRRSTTQYLTRS